MNLTPGLLTLLVPEMLLKDGIGVKGSDADHGRVEVLLRQELGTALLECVGEGKGGLMCEGRGFRSDAGLVFVKVNWEPQAPVMFEGEMASLNAILKTETVNCPKPKMVVGVPGGGAILVEEYIHMQESVQTHWVEIGRQLARLHLHNRTHGLHVTKFGFPVQTCFGIIVQENDWEHNWLEFYIKTRMEPQIELLEKQFNDSQVRTLWTELLPRLPLLFKDIKVTPSLLHGDIWLGNIAETAEGPVLFDPTSFYGHDEYDLALADADDFHADFYAAYHELNPLQAGWQGRWLLYRLHLYICHWNHWGPEKNEKRTLELIHSLKSTLEDISSS